MITSKRRRYKRIVPPDLFADLGPGDPGYRLRTGASGLDPLEAYQEQARMIGILLRAVMTGRVRDLGLPRVLAFLGALITLLAFVPATPLTLTDLAFKAWDRAIPLGITGTGWLVFGAALLFACYPIVRFLNWLTRIGRGRTARRRRAG